MLLAGYMSSSALSQRPRRVSRSTSATHTVLPLAESLATALSTSESSCVWRNALGAVTVRPLSVVVVKTGASAMVTGVPAGSSTEFSGAASSPFLSLAVRSTFSACSGMGRLPRVSILAATMPPARSTRTARMTTTLFFM